MAASVRGIFAAAMGSQLFRRLPLVETVAAAGQFLHLERPQTVNDRIVSWLVD